MIELSLWQLAAAGAYVIVTLILVRLLGVQREREILNASIRMTIQLFIAGYILTYVFDHPHWITTLLILTVMLTFAVINAIQRVQGTLPARLKRVMAVSLIFGGVSTLAWFLVVIVQGDAWRDPRYFIPIAGMLIGNAMTGVALGANRLVDGIVDQRPTIEASLMLGATPRVSTRRVVQQSFDASILPTINSMLGIGIVALPGMMSGQILAGQSPNMAIRYQIAIMLGIMACVAVSVIILVEWGYRAFFTPAAQLIEEEHQ